MLNLISTVGVTCLALSCALASANTQLPAKEIEIPKGETATFLEEVKTGKTFTEKLKENFGITYFTFFFGPGVHPDTVTYFPNQLGNPDNDGIYFQNQVSIRYKFSKNLAIDLQTRFKILLNSATQSPDYSFFRWEAPRIGISGKLLSGENWDLTGAINTDFPYFLPAPFSGYQAQQRKTLLTPGMFAALKIEPKNSKWSMFSVVSPRYFIYTDRNAAEPQYSIAGYIPQNKPELILSFQPTINYKVSPSTKITVGTTIDYRKHVVSNWNIFNANLVSNGNSSAWRLNAVPVYAGVTYSFGPALTVFPFVTTFPIAVQRINADTGKQASIWEATAFGMWISGVLF